MVEANELDHTQQLLLRGREAVRKMYGVEPPISRAEADLLGMRTNTLPRGAVGEASGVPAGEQEPTEERAAPEQEAEQLELPLDQPKSPQPAPKPAAQDDDWRQRYLTLQGKYNSELARIRADNAAVNDEVASLRKQMAALVAERDLALAKAKELDEKVRGKPWQDVSELGQDTVEAIRRGARDEAEQVIADLRKQITAMQQELQALRPAVGQSSMFALEQYLDRTVEGWREANTSDDFMRRWLREPDPISGIIREELFSGAVQANDMARVGRMFAAYLGEMAAKKPAKQAKAQDKAEPSSEQEARPPGLGDIAFPDGGASSSPVTTKGDREYITRNDLRNLQVILSDPVRTFEEKENARRRIVEAMQSGRFRE